MLPALAVLVVATSCTTVSNDLLQPVGTTVLVLTDTDLSTQSLTTPDDTIQAVDWELSEALLVLGNDPDGTDMLFDDACRFTDSAFTSPNAEGACSGGLVIGATEDGAISAGLTLSFTMTFRRAAPSRLDPGADEDGDEVINQADICPYVRNPDQADEDSDGIGDACSVQNPVTGEILLDSDGDSWPDTLDNCIWEPNTDQADSMGLGADGISDAIGDACAEQTVTVTFQGLQFDPVELTQQEGSVSFLTVDFRSSSSLRGCDWDSETCEFVPGEVRFCATDSLSSAISGCP
jgi:hypothetical protein